MFTGGRHPLAAGYVAVAGILLVACGTESSVTPSENSTASSTTASSTTASASSATASAAASAAEVTITPIVGTVLHEPVPVPATDGRTHLVYEVELTNATSQNMTVREAVVRADGEELLTLDAEALPQWMRVFGQPEPTATFGPGQAGRLWLDVALDEGATAPSSLEHVLTVIPETPSDPLLPETITETVAPVAVSTRTPIEVAPPVRGPGWLDGNGCCVVSAHRGAVSPLAGQFWAAERFAIDYVQLDADGKLYVGDPTRNETYPYFGADILAAGDGPVVAVVDDLPEQTPGSNPSGLKVTEYAGNHVVQDLGNGNYALYAHLQPGSITVQPGDSLTRGQSIAKLGNSGNSSAAHLHFHVMDGPDPLASNGLPFVFSAFDLTGQVVGDDSIEELERTGGPVPTSTTETGRRTGELPLYLDVTTFD